ncbi:MAG: hypothetical protein AAFY28_02085 [Actinomycetota bacterium]
MAPLLRLLASVWAIALGLFAGAVVLFLGPSEEVVCGEAEWPASIVQDWMSFRGHTDAANASLCSVPQNWVIFMAAILVLAAVGSVVAIWVSASR